MTLDLWMAVAALALGGIIKGATGAGAPIVAVPVMAMAFGVEVAVVTFTVPSLIMNIVQGWQFRAHFMPRAFTWAYALAGALGAMIGTWLLATITPELLLLAVAGVVLVYISFRLAVPGWVLGYAMAARLVVPVGVVAGILQGATGVSAPVSITFLNAMQLARPVFIATISVFFTMMSAVQVPTLVWLGLMDWTRFGYALVALVPLLAFMPVGSFLARHISRQAFDRVILGLLALVAVRLIWRAFS